MRRADITQGLNEILKAITTSGLERAIVIATSIVRVRPDSAVTRGPNTVPAEEFERVIHALQQYSIQAANYSNAAREIAQIFGLESLTGAKFWQAVFNADREILDEVFAMRQRISFITNYFPQVVQLLQPDSLSEALEGIATHAPGYEDKGVIRLILIVNDETPSSPSRISNLLEGTQTLYDTCAVINQEQPQELRIIACDSGSDQTFDLLGAAKIIDCVKELILSMWEKVVYFREFQTSQRIKLVAEALPVLEQIKKLEESKGIDPEQAARLRHGIIDGTGKFLGAKAIIAEMESIEVTHYNPRQLIAPSQKLLPSQAASSNSKEEDELNEEEQAILERLQKRATQLKPKKGPSSRGKRNTTS